MNTIGPARCRTWTRRTPKSVWMKKAATAIEVLRNAVTWFAARGLNVERALSDNVPAASPPPATEHARSSASV
jgi:hypothetical protein